jgi:hypothetical protein
VRVPKLPVGPSRPAHLSSGLLKMTDFSCGLILPKISQQPARQPVAGWLKMKPILERPGGTARDGHPPSEGTVGQPRWSI